MWAQITLNVALCRLRTREFRAAERDCTRVISQSAAVSEGELAKAHYRRATVRIAQANDKGGEGDAGSTKELRGALLPTTRPAATSVCGSLTRERAGRWPGGPASGGAAGAARRDCGDGSVAVRGAAGCGDEGGLESQARAWGARRQAPWPAPGGRVLAVPIIGNPSFTLS